MAGGGRRMTRHDYQGPGSFERLQEAAIALADCDSEDDRAYHRAKARLLQAVLAYKPRHREPRRPKFVEPSLDLPLRPSAGLDEHDEAPVPFDADPPSQWLLAPSSTSYVIPMMHRRGYKRFQET